MMIPRQDARKRAVYAARVVAVLAGGAALGAAGAVTLAAWQEPEVTATTFQAAAFESQSQGSDGTWAHHAPGSAMQMSADLSALSPGGTPAAPTAGDSHYAWLNLRMSEASTARGTAVLTDTTADGALAGVLEYRVVTRDASTADCTAAGFSADATYLAGGPTSYSPPSRRRAPPVSASTSRPPRRMPSASASTSASRSRHQATPARPCRGPRPSSA